MTNKAYQEKEDVNTNYYNNKAGKNPVSKEDDGVIKLVQMLYKKENTKKKEAAKWESEQKDIYTIWYWETK